MGALIEQGVAVRAIPGERVCGDGQLVKYFEGGVLLAVVDGLGHGAAAAAAADIALATLDRHADEEPGALLRRCHQALHGSRGVAMSLASIDSRAGLLAWLGVGNVDSLLLRCALTPPKAERLLTRGGVVGFQLPPLHRRSLPVAEGDLLVFATDGIRSDFAAALPPADPSSRRQNVQVIANRIMEGFAKGTDDALVLVARYLGVSDG